MSLRDRIVALEAEVGQRTHEGMTPSPDARGAYFLVQLALRAALAADAAHGGERAPLTVLRGEKVPDQGCFVAEDGAGEKMCRKPTWVCLSHWEEVNRERVRLTNRNAELEPEVEVLRQANAALDAEAQRLGRLLAAAAPSPETEGPCGCGHAREQHMLVFGHTARDGACCALVGDGLTGLGTCACAEFRPGRSGGKP